MKKITLLSILIFSFQNISSQEISVEEIIVTATKTEKTLQEVPVAVSVVSAETIEKANIVDILDLKAVVPSLDTRQRSTSTQSTFFIRGFGNGDYNQGIEPSVAVFIDGVYRSKMQSQISDLPLIERIEVLRGPQSTLFGKNATAGVINVVTKKPSFEKSSFITTTMGNYNSQIGKIKDELMRYELIAESLGKKGTGFFPSISNSKDDLRSPFSKKDSSFFLRSSS